MHTQSAISFALNYPNKVYTNVANLNLTSIKSLNFENVDEKVFKSVLITREAIRKGTSSVISLNAANEVAVEAFLNKRINFNKIIDIIEMTFLKNTNSKISNINDIIEVDRDARIIAYDLIKKGGF